MSVQKIRSQICVLFSNLLTIVTSFTNRCPLTLLLPASCFSSLHFMWQKIRYMTSCSNDRYIREPFYNILHYLIFGLLSKGLKSMIRNLHQLKHSVWTHLSLLQLEGYRRCGINLIFWIIWILITKRIYCMKLLFLVHKREFKTWRHMNETSTLYVLHRFTSKIT